MNLKELRMIIRQILIEEKAKEVLGEPDSSSEKHRDEPQPQYDVEEEEADKDEASMVAGIAGFTGPLGVGNGPGDKPYGAQKNKK